MRVRSPVTLHAAAKLVQWEIQYWSPVIVGILTWVLMFFVDCGERPQPKWSFKLLIVTHYGLDPKYTPEVSEVWKMIGSWQPVLIGVFIDWWVYCWFFCEEAEPSWKWVTYRCDQEGCTLDPGSSFFLSFLVAMDIFPLPCPFTMLFLPWI